MLHHDPKTHVVSTTRSQHAEGTQPLARTLAGFAAAGLVTRLLELAVSRRPR